MQITKVQGLLFIRSRAYLVYATLLFTILVGTLILEFLNVVSVAVPVTLVTAILFFQLPMLALLIGPISEHSRRQDWLWATPLELPQLFMAQFISTVIILTAMLTLVYGIAFGFFLLMDMPLAATAQLFGFGLLALLLVTCLQCSFIFVILSLLPNTLVVTAIAVVVDVLLGLSLFQPTETLFSVQNFSLRSWYIDAVAGIGAERSVFLALLLLYALSVPILLLLAIGLYRLTDGRVGWRANLFSVVSLIGVALLVVNFGWFNYRAVVRDSLVPTSSVTQTETWIVLAANQQATVADDTLSVEAELTLQNVSTAAQPTIELLLNTGLEATSAQVNGQSVEVVRMGEVIRLQGGSWTVNPASEVHVRLNYSGRPILLREDYRAVEDVALSSSPPIFRRAYVSYLNKRVLQWSRDSDWLAWPATAYAHVAREHHRLTIAVDSALLPISSGDVLGKDDDITTLHWASAPPQFLVAAGPYVAHHSPNGTVWLGELSRRTSITRGEQALAFYQQIVDWMETIDNSVVTYAAVELPYTQSIETGGDIIGLPSDNSNPRRGLGTQSQLMLDLAIQVSQGWLVEQISWPRLPLTTRGELQYFSVNIADCDTQTGDCNPQNLGGANPQAPSGRLVEEAMSPVILKAFSIATSYHIFPMLLDEDSMLSEQKAAWKGVIINSEDTQGISSYGGVVPMDGKLQGAYSNRDNCELAHYVVALVDYQEQFGVEMFKVWLNQLHEKHPVNSAPLTEEQVWQIGQALSGNEWQAPKPACYSNSVQQMADD